ncbi:MULTISPECIES: hypothetical protein [Bacillus]|uniref:hypothetical protein n=1 Tax=Bacillus TaxID=1386 RepID=UPI001072482F|nr:MULTISPECIES: hypothetical protein [Bacillus]MCL7871048.1 hypothetical protein [Bacillus altitudinis]QEO62951.1 hypothetical protein EVS87_012215 [Bacillus altitudinis]UDF15254.1 hypothetical protein LG951_12175 [Bacillus pumilus]
MALKYGEFDLLDETVNNILNTNALLIILNKKGFITSDEFIQAKEEAIADFKNDFPTLTKKR